VSGREKSRSGDVRTQRRCTRHSQDAQDVGVLVGMASGPTALSNAKSGRNVGSTSRPDSRLAFGRQVRQTHRTHRTQGIIFADVFNSLCCMHNMIKYEGIPNSERELCLSQEKQKSQLELEEREGMVLSSGRIKKKGEELRDQIASEMWSNYQTSMRSRRFARVNDD